MVRAVLQQGNIIPVDPLPPDWQEGAALQVAKADVPAFDIDAWAKTMNQLCAGSSDEDENTMHRAIDEHRQQAKDQVRRDMGLTT